MASTTPKVNDPTFRSYSNSQAKAYAAGRQIDNAAIYKVVFDHHAAAEGQFDLLLDCGCGPGNITRDLAPLFDQAIGVDAGSAMIEVARGLGGQTKPGVDIRYEVSPAETFSQVEGLKPGSVDMLTVSVAVHWFEMDKFYAEAAKVLKPGGTLAIWTRASGFPHPSEPKAKELKDIMLHFEHNVIGAYELPGNRLSRDMYDNLKLPWDVSPSVSAFQKHNFVKHDYDRDGILSDGKSFFGGAQEYKLDDLEKTLATASMVTRWREAHPDLVDTEKDCVKVFVNELREVLSPKETCLSGASTTILLFKKSA